MKINNKKIPRNKKFFSNNNLSKIINYGSGFEFISEINNQIRSNKKKVKIFFVSDEKIWKNCHEFFPKDFLAEISEYLFLKNPKADENNLKKINSAIKDCDFILGFGSGTINDLCKYTSAQKNISYSIIPSALSMNGYLSKNASITISGHKKTLSATLPKNVFCDFRILKSAPLTLAKAGVGDSLCFYSCWFDWYLSHKILGTEFHEKPFLLLKDKMNFLVKNFYKFSFKDDEFLKLLSEILFISGYGMTIAKGSYPASQSEHMIAHTIDMKYPELSNKNLHGAQIAVATMVSSRLQKNILLMKEIPNLFSDIEDIDKFFGKKVAIECKKEYEQKVEKIQNKNSVNWDEIKKDLKKIYFSEKKLREIFLHFKINTSPKSLGLSATQYQDCVRYSKFMRNRFTCLDFFNHK